MPSTAFLTHPSGTYSIHLKLAASVTYTAQHQQWLYPSSQAALQVFYRICKTQDTSLLFYHDLLFILCQLTHIVTVPKKSNNKVACKLGKKKTKLY